jgi:hypothetical protein
MDLCVKRPAHLNMHCALKFLAGQVPQGRPTNKLAIGFEDFGGQGRSYISRWSKETS